MDMLRYGRTSPLYGLLCLVFSTLLFSSFSHAAFRDTPANWKCYNSVSGTWAFGRAPMGCDVSAFTNATQVAERYQPVVFMDRVSSHAQERRRYMTELQPIVRDAALYYLNQKKPSASSAERNAWVRAAYAISHQESFWSHYRIASDGRLKMMRGDYGHGHGLMQVDDRWHFPALGQGKGWNLVENITYSLDEYYAAWQRAPSQWCVSSASDWTSRARAAYSAYNGGPSKICRWTNPNDKWARNDKGFLQKWNGQDWRDYVTDPNRTASLDVSCLINGGNSCFEGQDPVDYNNALIKVDTGDACVFKEDKFYCIESDYNASCLAKVSPFDSSNVIKLAVSDMGAFERENFNSHDLCQATVAGYVPVTKTIVLQQANSLRATPGGLKLADVPSGARLQVLDSVVTDNAKFNRFYQVRYNNQLGYIWGGTDADYQEWLFSDGRIDTSILTTATHGAWVQVKNDVGINLRTAPRDGQVLVNIPKNTKVLVKDVIVQGYENRLYYQVEYLGVDGYIYGGYLRDNGTNLAWAQVVSAPAGNADVAAYCPEGAWYDADLKACVDSENAYGPFSSALTERCKAAIGNSGNPASCETEWTVTINGNVTEVQRWAVEFYRNLAMDTQTYRGECPYGSVASATYGYHCVESEDFIAQEVFGPFGSQLVETCEQIGGGSACYLNRWSPLIYASVINRSSLAPGDGDDDGDTDTPVEPPVSNYPACPNGTSFDNGLGFCVNAEHGYGPFPQAMVDACVKSGGGPACTEGVAVKVNGYDVALPRWSIAYVKGLRGASACPAGTQKTSYMSNRCVEFKNGKPTDVYGPFSKSLVDECVAKNGGNTCYTQRWNASFYAWIDDNASLEPPVSATFPYYNQNYNASEGWRACNITSIAMALDHYGITSKAKLGQRTPDYLYKKYYLQFTMEGLKRIFDTEARRVGSGLRDYITYKGTVSQLRERARAGKPTVVHGWFTGSGHIVQVIGFDGTHYIVHDPNGRWNERYKGGYVSTRSGGNAARYSAAAFERAVDRGGIWLHRFN